MDEWLGGILLGAGLLIGWILRDRLIDGRAKGEVKKFADFAAEMQQGDELLAASNARSDLWLLIDLEQKQYDNAANLLSHKLGAFYHSWNAKAESAAQSEHIREALKQIREAAKKSKAIAAVIAYQPPV